MKSSILRTFVGLVCILLYVVPTAAIKLYVKQIECVEQDVPEPDSLVTVSLEAGETRGKASYFDFVVRDSLFNQYGCVSTNGFATFDPSIIGAYSSKLYPS
jgi:hypothetical protein